MVSTFPIWILGQLAFVIVALGVIWLLVKTKINWPLWIKKVPFYAIGSIAFFWLIERVWGSFRLNFVKYIYGANLPESILTSDGIYTK